MAFRWRADERPLIVLLGPPPLINLKKEKKKRCQKWTPLTKLSGSVHHFKHNITVLDGLAQ